MATKIRLKPQKTFIKTIRNMFFPGVSGFGPPGSENGNIQSNIVNDPKNLNKYRGPVQLLRIKIDPSFWRAAVIEAELPLPSLPYRVKMQQIYIDTVLNGHVSACMQKRKNLTLLKQFHICDDNDVTDEVATELLNTKWFQLMRNYIHDAQYYGYSLLTFGDMVESSFPNIQLTRRSDVSPDRLNLTSFMYIPTGISFMEGDYFDWSLYVSTPSENGVSKCGYGFLYKVALYEIIMRSLIGWNTDYTERYGMPTVVAKTVKDNEEERGKLEEALNSLGSSGWMIMDKMDDFEMVAPEGAGTGWQSYDNLESRCKKTISAIILGHEDGISSTPGKLGSSQGSKPGQDVDNTPIGRALAECESTDSRFEEMVMNDQLIPKLIKLGIKIPVGKKYKLKNDQQQAVEEKRDADTAQLWATVAQTMGMAQLKMSARDFEEKTGIKAEEVITPEPEPFNNFKAKLLKTYSNVKD